LVLIYKNYTLIGTYLLHYWRGCPAFDRGQVSQVQGQQVDLQRDGAALTDLLNSSLALIIEIISAIGMDKLSYTQCTVRDGFDRLYTYLHFPLSTQSSALFFIPEKIFGPMPRKNAVDG